MSERLARWLRELFRGRDLGRARAAEAQALAVAALGTVPESLRRELRRLAKDQSGAVRLGQFAEGALSKQDLLVDVGDLHAHALILGSSGAGKTFAVLGAVSELLQRAAVASLFVLDMKGEASELLTSSVLPAIAASLPAGERDAFLNRIVVIDPFSADAPPLNVLRRDPGLAIEIQARDVAECFQSATDCDVSTRMETVLDWTLRLMIEVGGSFNSIRRALQEPAVLEALVRESKDPDVARYFLTRFPSEPKASKLALLSRLDRFLALPMTRLSLGADSCLNFDELLADRIVIVNLGRAPAGLQSVARFFAMIIMTRLVRAIFRRPPRSQGKHALVVADEWQVALSPALAAEFASILELARSRDVHLWLCNQMLTQLDRHGAGLRGVVLGITALQLAFRLAPDDARALRGIFPSTGTLPRPHAGPWTPAASSPYMSAAEEMAARENAASRLPPRVAYWTDRRKPWGSLLVRSATLPLPAASSLPADIVRRCARGTIAFTHAELERMRDDEDKWLDALAAGPPRRAQPLQARVITMPAPVSSPARLLPTGTPTPQPPPAGAKRRRRPGGGGLPNI